MSALAKFKSAPPQLTVVRDEADNLINIDGRQYTYKELKTLEKAGALSTAYKNNPASSTLTGPALQGPFQGNDTQFGIFSSPGVRPERFSALSRPLSIARLLTDQGALQRSEYFNEILEIMTGVLDATTGLNATGFCGNPPVPG